MVKKTRILIIRTIYVLIDILSITTAFYIACWTRQHTLSFNFSLNNLLLNDANPYKPVFLFWTLIILYFNSMQGLYQTRREQLESREVWAVLKSVATASFSIIVLAYIFKIEDFPRSVFIISVFLISLFLSFWRVFKKILVDFLVANGYNNFNTMVIGAGKVGMTLAQEIKKRPGLGLRIVGFLDDFKSSEQLDSSVKLLGSVSEFSNIAKREFVTKVFITIHPDSGAFYKLLEDADELGIAVHVVPQGYELMGGELSKYNIGIVPILEYCDIRSPLQLGKRAFDLVMGSLLCVLLFPVFIFIGLAIKYESVGPVFYASKRYGRRGQIFKMLKFRSMVKNADVLLKDVKSSNEVDGPIFKMKKDPRITKVGAFLRKFSLDELPQVINVIHGDMSLVGPRPLPIEQVEKEDFRQLKRLDIRPGMTGLWQVRGRSDISFQRLLKWDIWYINNWSFWLDMHILFQTIPVVLKGRGAY